MEKRMEPPKALFSFAVSQLNWNSPSRACILWAHGIIKVGIHDLRLHGGGSEAFGNRLGEKKGVPRQRRPCEKRLRFSSHLLWMSFPPAPLPPTGGPDATTCPSFGGTH